MTVESSTLLPKWNLRPAGGFWERDQILDCAFLLMSSEVLADFCRLPDLTV